MWYTLITMASFLCQVLWDHELESHSFRAGKAALTRKHVAKVNIIIIRTRMFSCPKFYLPGLVPNVWMSHYTWKVGQYNLSFMYFSALCNRLVVRWTGYSWQLCWLHSLFHVPLVLEWLSSLSQVARQQCHWELLAVADFLNTHIVWLDTVQM